MRLSDVLSKKVSSEFIPVDNFLDIKNLKWVNPKK